MSTENNIIKREAMKKLFTVLLWVYGSYFASAQGWEINFGGSSLDEGQTVLATADGGSLLIGYGTPVGIPGLDQDLSVYMVRTDVDGRLIWTKYIDDGFDELIFDAVLQSDGSVLMTGYIRPTPISKTALYILKIDKFGRKLWSKTIAGDFDMQGRAVSSWNNNGLVVAGFISVDGNQTDILVIRLDEDGNEIWRKTTGNNRDDFGAGVAVWNDQIYVLANVSNPNGLDSDIQLMRLNAQGDIVWTVNEGQSAVKDMGNDLIVTSSGNLVLVGEKGNVSQVYVASFNTGGSKLWESTIGGALAEEGRAIAEDIDGGFVITGSVEVDEINVDLLLAKTDAQGTLLWTRNHGKGDQFYETGYGIAIGALGGYYVGGSTGRFSSFDNDMVLLKADREGNTLTNYIHGRVFFDSNADCTLQSQEEGLIEWHLTAEGNGNTYYGSTDSAGRFSIRVDTGVYIVSLIAANPAWEICFDEVDVMLGEFYEEETVNFAVKGAIDCAYPEVKVSTPFLADCADITYQINYINHSAAVAQDAYIEVTLDDEMEFVSSGIPFSSVVNKKYTFRVGNLAPLQRGRFSIQARMSCVGIAEGQAGLVKAEIFPNLACTEKDMNWDLSNLEVSGKCVNGEVQLRVVNSGEGDMIKPARSFVIEDDVMLTQVPIQLTKGKDTVLTFKGNGPTYRLITEQSSGHPAKSVPTAAVEGCVVDALEYSVGKVLMFPEDDGKNNIDIDVEETVGSAIAMMRGYPKGYQDSLLENKTEITYKIVFRNNGTDTVDRVVIRDTLSSFLDFTSVRAGVSNHPFQMEVYEDGVVKITFTGLNLFPNSSQSFVTFSVSQKPDLPPGTVIDNSAAIFLGIDAPVQTNLKRYVIAQFPEFVQLSTDRRQMFIPGVKVEVFPNPFFEEANIRVVGKEFNQIRFNLIDAQGKVVMTRIYNGNELKINRRDIPVGLYFYSLESEGRWINSGKLIAQ
jgi:uncharacterized repeat protein (TIGR01451 family)